MESNVYVIYQAPFALLIWAALSAWPKSRRATRVPARSSLLDYRLNTILVHTANTNKVYRSSLTIEFISNIRMRVAFHSVHRGFPVFFLTC